MKKIKLILFFVVTFSMIFCNKNVDEVSMQQFQDKILNENTVVLDVRSEEEYFGPLGHIDGAILIPINELENRIEELKKFHPNGNIGSISDIVNAALFMTDNRNSFLNGSILNLDGGISSRLHDPD